VTTDWRALAKRRERLLAEADERERRYLAQAVDMQRQLDSANARVADLENGLSRMALCADSAGPRDVLISLRLISIDCKALLGVPGYADAGAVLRGEK